MIFTSTSGIRPPGLIPVADDVVEAKVAYIVEVLVAASAIKE